MAEKISKYEYVKQSIQKKIADHEWKGNQVIPSENKLCEYYQVSRITIRRAMDELVHEGVLYRIKGKGCFVREKETDKLSHIYSFTEAILLQANNRPNNRFLFQKNPPARKLPLKWDLHQLMKYTRSNVCIWQISSPTV
uniref:GntR family transcriptional regulator n=1 Tax=Mediterraneibacter glycyrrhizinilyticus TaxID=342942 RepID=UPI000AE45C9D